MDIISCYTLGKFLEKISNAKTGVCSTVYNQKQKFIQKCSKLTEIQQLTCLSDYFL